MSQKKNEGILFPTEIRVVGSYTDRLLSFVVNLKFIKQFRTLYKKIASYRNNSLSLWNECFESVSTCLDNNILWYP